MPTLTVRPGRYVHRPTKIEAMHYLPQTRADVRRWLTEAGAIWWTDFSGNYTRIATPQGSRLVQYGDWVIRGVIGEWYAVQDQVFRQGYQEHGK